MALCVYWGLSPVALCVYCLWHFVCIGVSRLWHFVCIGVSRLWHFVCIACGTLCVLGSLACGTLCVLRSLACGTLCVLRSLACGTLCVKTKKHRLEQCQKIALDDDHSYLFFKSFKYYDSSFKDRIFLQKPKKGEMDFFVNLSRLRWPCSIFFTIL